jgi:hypothetical protein
MRELSGGMRTEYSKGGTRERPFLKSVWCTGESSGLLGAIRLYIL